MAHANHRLPEVGGLRAASVDFLAFPEGAGETYPLATHRWTGEGLPGAELLFALLLSQLLPDPYVTFQEHSFAGGRR